MGRKEDLEHLIHEVAELIREWEEDLLMTDDKAKRRELSRKIRARENLLDEWLDEYRRLCGRLALPMDPEVEQLLAARTREEETSEAQRPLDQAVQGRQIATLPGLEKDERLRRFQQLWREAVQERDRDILTVLQKRWRVSLRQDALTRAAEALGKGDRPGARDWIQMVEELDGRADSEVRAWRYLLDSPEGTDSIREGIHACALLAGRSYGKRLGNLLGERLRTLLEQPGGIVECEQAVLKHPRGRWLLRQERIRNYLEDKARSEEEGSLSARRLLILADQEMIWPPLWPSPRPDDPDLIAQALELLGWSKNPFGPERAEEEADLPSFFVEPPRWSEISASLSLALTGAVGMGKTAALLLWTSKRREQGGLFPVWLSPRPTLTANSRRQLLEVLTETITEAILDFLIRNSNAFPSMSPTHQRAVANLVLHHIGPDDLEAHLIEKGVERDLATALRDSASGAGVSREDTEIALWVILSQAHLAGFWGYELLLDIPKQWCDSLTPVLLRERLRPLLRMIPLLEKANCYLKIAVPTPQALVPITVETVHLEWSPDHLRQLLDQRLRQVGGESLAQLFGPDRPDDPDGWIVEAAQGSPRRLVRLGNWLLERFGEKGRLSVGEMKVVIKEEGGAIK